MNLSLSFSEGALVVYTGHKVVSTGSLPCVALSVNTRQKKFFLRELRHNSSKVDDRPDVVLAGQLGEVEIRLLTVYADILSKMLRNYSSVQDKRRKLQVFLKYPRLLQKSAIFQRFSEAIVHTWLKWQFSVHLHWTPLCLYRSMGKSKLRSV